MYVRCMCRRKPYDYFGGRDVWKKRYYDEKKKAPPVEEQCNKLRQQLEQLQHKIVSQLEGVVKESDQRRPGNKTYELVCLPDFTLDGGSPILKSFH